MLLICILSLKQDVYGEELLDNYDFTAIEEFVNTNESMEDFSFFDMVENLITGNFGAIFEEIWKRVVDAVFGEFGDCITIVKRIILISIIGAIFTNISNVFRNSQISETGFYVTYMIVAAISLGSFYLAVDIAKSMVAIVIEFMEILMPLMVVGVGISSGSVSAIGFYEAVLLVITVVDNIVLNILIPVIVTYVMISFVNTSFKDEKLGKLADFIKLLINWAIKTMYGAILGLNIIKGMILPYVDALKESAFVKTIEAIPGVGDSVSSMASVTIGTSNLIKNSIGVGALIILIFLSMLPVVKLAVMVLMHKVAGAVVEPVSDKRIVNLQECIAEGISLILKAITMVSVLFLITIALVCISTNINYFST